MASRPEPNTPVVMTADGYVKQNPGIVYSMTIAVAGATAGDKVVLRDGGPTGTIVVYGVVTAANGTEPTIHCGKYGARFSTSIYYSEQATAAGKIRATICYD